MVCLRDHDPAVMSSGLRHDIPDFDVIRLPDGLDIDWHYMNCISDVWTGCISLLEELLKIVVPGTCIC